MAKDKHEPAAVPAQPAPPGEQSLPGMEDVGRLPSDVVRKAIHRRLTLHDALPDDPAFIRRWRFLWEWLTFKELTCKRLTFK